MTATQPTAKQPNKNKTYGGVIVVSTEDTLLKVKASRKAGGYRPLNDVILSADIYWLVKLERYLQRWAPDGQAARLFLMEIELLGARNPYLYETFLPTGLQSRDTELEFRPNGYLDTSGAAWSRRSTPKHDGDGESQHAVYYGTTLHSSVGLGLHLTLKIVMLAQR